MSDIFISYASTDRDRAKQLAEKLERQGWSVWWDRTIPAGAEFDAIIEEAIDQAKCVIVIWSSASVVSRWVRTEASEGSDRGILVPVLVEVVRIPLAFRRIQAADLTTWDGNDSDEGFKHLVTDISRILGPPPVTKLPSQQKTKEENNSLGAEIDHSAVGNNHVPEGKVSPFAASSNELEKSDGEVRKLLTYVLVAILASLVSITAYNLLTNTGHEEMTVNTEPTVHSSPSRQVNKIDINVVRSKLRESLEDRAIKFGVDKKQGLDVEQELLPIDKAFIIAIAALNEREIIVSWNIAEGYYLYRDEIKFDSVAGVGNVNFPVGIKTQDEWHGETETYRGLLEIVVTLRRPLNIKAVETINIRYQGGADRGIVYPPKNVKFAPGMLGNPIFPK